MKKELNKYNNLRPQTDIHEDKDKYILVADLPGVSKEQLQISIENNILEISGTRSSNNKELNLKHSEFSGDKFYRSFRLSNDIDTNKVEASHENGVLTLTLKKVEEAKPKQIKISA